MAHLAQLGLLVAVPCTQGVDVVPEENQTTPRSCHEGEEGENSSEFRL